MSTTATSAGPGTHRPRLGVQGPVVAWSDPWSPELSETVMRTGTGRAIASQDLPVEPQAFIETLTDLGADFYVHHVLPGADDSAMFRDLAAAGVDVVLGNEYGNINGPHTAGTNRFDIPAETIRAAAQAGCLAGVVYDEPEHLQINAAQYLREAFLPHFGATDGTTPDEALAIIVGTARRIVDEVAATTSAPVPVLAEHVFPVLFHALARAGMTPAPKVMKESFQPLQLATALGASVQYDRQLWICADLWGPDIGPWFTRAPGFPGHSPAEFASALRMAYFFSPDALFLENIDPLLRHRGAGVFARTEFGDVWQEFVREFVPAHPLDWHHREAVADIALIHADDSDFGRAERPFGNRRATAPETSRSIFAAWHLISHGSIPAHGSCLHAPGYEFPRRRLDDLPRTDFPLTRGASRASETHGLFHAARSVLVFDETVDDARLGDPELIIVAGSRLPTATAAMVRGRAEAGAVVAIASWLTPREWRRSDRVGSGRWIAFDDLLSPETADELTPFLGARDLWTQRFGSREVRIRAADAQGIELAFEVADTPDR